MPEAIEVFVSGFTFTRSFTHPYELHRHGDLWVMRDAPRKMERCCEVIAHGTSVSEVMRQVSEYKPPRHFLCYISSPEEDALSLKKQIKGFGYRTLRSEPMMVAKTGGERYDAPGYDLRRVTDLQTAGVLNEAARRQQILATHLSDDSPLRLYAAFSDGKPAAWVKSIRTDEKSSWVSNLFVLPEHRRQGLGRALMTLMLGDDRARGIDWSVLLATTAGSKLYSAIGYEQIGLLQLFAPPRKN